MMMTTQMPVAVETVETIASPSNENAKESNSMSNSKQVEIEYEMIEFEEMSSSDDKRKDKRPEESSRRFFSSFKSSSSSSATFQDKVESSKSSNEKCSVKKPLPDETNLLGYRVELKWSSGKWYRGTVCEYDKVKNRHYVLYDDGDKKWYHLPEMVFRFVKEEDEWIDVPERGTSESSSASNSQEVVENMKKPIQV